MPLPTPSLQPYDGVLILSFGGPESVDDVIPFLERVTAGRGIPAERLALVGEHYFARGGVSPINDQCRALRGALEAELAARGVALPVLWGNRNSAPFLVDALQEALERGLTRLCVIVTSAYSSYSSCRQYRENLAAALAEVGPAGDGLVIDKIRPYAVSEGFGKAWIDLVCRAGAALSAGGPVTLLGVTHSIPESMDDTSGPGDGEGNLYVDQHLRVLSGLADALSAATQAPVAHELVFCSRSGPPTAPWLAPDIGDRLRELAADGIREVLVAPIGFVSDHMEVIQDLDTDAAAVAQECGITMIRIPTPGIHPEFVAGLVDLLMERAAQARGVNPALTSWCGGDVRGAVCAPGCCPNLRVALPALCGTEVDL